jgi:hypothetical protein
MGLNTVTPCYCEVLRTKNSASNYTNPNNPILFETCVSFIWLVKIIFYITLRSASNSHLEILERFQSKVLLILTDASWYVPNVVIRHDLQVPTFRQEAQNYSVTYRQQLTDHPKSGKLLISRAKLQL